MPQISHNYLQKLRREVSSFDQWLASTRSNSDGSARADDLQSAFTRANAIYLKALALYRTTGEENESSGEEAGEATLTGG